MLLLTCLFSKKKRMQDNTTNQSSGTNTSSTNAKPTGRFSTLSFSSPQQRPASQPAATQPRSFFSNSSSTSSSTPSNTTTFQTNQNSLSNCSFDIELCFIFFCKGKIRDSIMVEHHREISQVLEEVNVIPTGIQTR